MRMVSLSPLFVLALGCGSLGDPSGIEEPVGLPDRGAGGFVEHGEILLAASAGQPSDGVLIPSADGGWDLVYARAEDGCLGRSSAVSSQGPFDTHEEIACPSAPWEGEALIAPSPVRDGGALRVFYGVASGEGIGAIEIGANSAQGVLVLSPSLSWEQGWIGDPTVVRTEEQWVLFYIGADGGGVGRATSDDGWTWTVGADPLMVGCDEPCDRFDGDGLHQPYVRRRRSPLSRQIWDMWYVGVSGRRRTLGFAGSFDGIVWSRYPHNPLRDTPTLGPMVFDDVEGRALLSDGDGGIVLRPAY